jgi:hypothetical protein
MERRKVISIGTGIVCSVALAGCSFGGIGNNTPAEFRLEAEETSLSEICDRTIQRIEDLDFRDQEPTQEAIESGEAISETSARRSIYVQYNGSFFLIEVRDRQSDHKEIFSLESELDTFDSMCEIIRSNLIADITSNNVSDGTYEVIDETVTTGTFESSPLSEAANDALNFFADIDSGRGIHPIYVKFGGDYYLIDMYYNSGE